MWLFVTNLPADATDADLAALFAPFGTVQVTAAWGATGRVGLVALAAGTGAAVAALDGAEFRGRTLCVRPVLPAGGDETPHPGCPPVA